MAKSLRSKRKKRLRTIRREILEPYYDQKDAAKYAALEVALAAPKLPVFVPKSNNMLEDAPASASVGMDVEMADGGNDSGSHLKPSGGVGKKRKNKFKAVKSKRFKTKGKLTKKRNSDF